MRTIRPLAQGISKWGEALNSDTKIKIERYWRDYVINSNNNFTQNGKKCYILSMFPYPSGHLHMGHVRVYAISDSIARFKKMNGMNVIHPMGWDAFGLPAENAAIQRELQPDDWTKSNIKNMKEQLLNLGCHFDWERELNTSDVSYYKWTQYLFLELYKAGLAYKKDALVNWDPVDQTVLAEEQVDANGCSWRSGAKVEKKLLNQWFIRTTYFAKQLYDGLDDPELSGWKDIINVQRHWIGECNGISIDFPLIYENKSLRFIKTITGWTDKPETLLYAKFIAIPSKHILNKTELITSDNENLKRLSVSAMNPITNEKIPIFVIDEVDYAESSDVYIGSPDLRSFDRYFASLASLSTDNEFSFHKSDAELSALRQKVCEIALSKKVGGYPVSSKLKDWLISRQRYWGTPIPVVYCKTCGPKPVPIESLPVSLPRMKFGFSLKNNSEWIASNCPECGSEAVRETDTMDTFVDSSWYFLRYLDPKNLSVPFSGAVNENMPVDLYVGGKEHAVLHLYYARFMNHFLHSIGKVSDREPFKRLLVQGMVKGKTYKIKQCGKYIHESQVKVLDEKKGLAVTINDNLPVEMEWEKMSKSKHNGVDPSDMFKEYGCDTTRLLMLADVAPMSHRNWSTKTFPGVLNWQKKLWNIVDELRNIRETLDQNKIDELQNTQEFKNSEHSLWQSRNFLISDITFNFNYTNQLSVGITRMLTLTSRLKKFEKKFIGASKEYELALAAQLIMLSPIAPHFACELWAGFLSAQNRINTSTCLFNWEKNVLDQKWPVIDVDFELDLLVLVNGKLLGNVKILPDELNKLTKEKAVEIAFQQDFMKNIQRNRIQKTILQTYTGCRGTIMISTLEEMNLEKGVIESVI